MNPHYDIGRAESTAWVRSFKADAPDSIDTSLLLALGLPRADKDTFRMGCDLLILMLYFDDIIEVDLIDEHEARLLADIIVDGLQNPDKARPVGEWIGGEMARQIGERVIRLFNPTSRIRFINAFEAYCDAAVQEAADQTVERIHNIQSYMEIRRGTIATRVLFSLLEVGMDLPEDVWSRKEIETLRCTAIDLIIIGNDIYSYNKEQAHGETHNLVVVAMNELKMNLDETVSWMSDLNNKLVREFLTTYNVLRRSELYTQVGWYVEGLGNWVRGIDAFSFKSERYFGTRESELEKGGIIELLPEGSTRMTCPSIR